MSAVLITDDGGHMNKKSGWCKSRLKSFFFHVNQWNPQKWVSYYISWPLKWTQVFMIRATSCVYVLHAATQPWQSKWNNNLEGTKTQICAEVSINSEEKTIVPRCVGKTIICDCDFSPDADSCDHRAQKLNWSEIITFSTKCLHVSSYTWMINT